MRGHNFLESIDKEEPFVIKIRLFSHFWLESVVHFNPSISMETQIGRDSYIYFFLKWFKFNDNMRTIFDEPSKKEQIVLRSLSQF